MATTRSRFCLSVAFAFLAFPLLAGNFRTPLEARIADEFPFMARELASAVPGAADTRVLAGRAVNGRVATSQGLQAFLPNDANEPIVIANGAREVVLRAELAGIGVQRAVSDGAAHERLLIESAAPRRTIEYSIVSMRGIADVTSDGRSIRFISADRSARDLVLSPPSLVDATGVPSQRASWSVGGERDGRVTILRLTVDSTMLRGPVLATFSARAAQTTTATTGRTRVVKTPPAAQSGGGTISGSLRDAATGNAISGGLIHVYDAFGTYVLSAFTDQDGNYTSADELSTGNYFVAALPSGYEPKLYNNIACPNGVCPITGGTQVPVTHAENTAGIDFLVTSTSARIAGRVSNSVTSAGLGNVGVRFYDSGGDLVASALSDASGNYIAEMPFAGTFYARTFNFEHAGYVDSLYNNIACAGCVVTTGTAISATVGSITQNVNFPLNPNGGLIVGNLTDSGTTGPIAGETVYIFNSAGARASFAITDATGGYVSFNGLVTGNYYVATAPSGYSGEVYNNLPCADLTCDPTTGTAVAVTLGARTTGIDFSLTSFYAQATGIVSDSANSNPLSDVPVVFYDSFGDAVAVGFSDAATGRYTVRLPDSGLYFARTFVEGSHPTYIDELYNNIPCSNCNPTSGTQISVSVGQTTSNINFALSNNGGSISGRIIDSGTNAGVPNATINIYDSTGTQVSYATTDAQGDYTSATPLVSGNYYVVAVPFGYSWELYDNIACPNADCLVTQGTAVPVTLGQNTANINFTLAGNIGQITGRVTSAATSNGVPNVTITIYNSSSAAVANTSTDENGNYSVVLTQSGTYFARTANAGLFVDELYDNISCPNGSCTISSGTGISVTVGATTANINFSLEAITCPTIVVTPASLASGSVGTAYSDTVFASGGLSPYTFSITDGTLPPGLTIGASSGVISGTPTTSGTFGFTVTAVDDNGCSGELSYSIAVAGQPPTIDDVFPTSGSRNGGTVVTISGSSFGNLQSVNFDGSPATILNFTATEINVRTPAHALGTVDVVVSTTDGNATALQAYTYTNEASVTLTSSLNPSTFGQSVTFTATLSEPLASGTMTFYDGTTVLAVKTIVPATLGDDDHPPTAAQPTTFTTSALNAGTHPITAVYSGDANYGSSTSNMVNQVVNRAPRTVTLTVTPNPSTYGDAITLTATVSPTAETSTVTFRDGTTVLATVAVVGGSASYTTSALNAGTHPLSAGTPESANYLAGTSNTVSQVVNKATPVFSNLSSVTVVLGTATTVISGDITYGTLIPTGSVTINVNGTNYNAPIGVDGSFNATVATAGLPPVATGYTITFTYGGDTNFNGITGSSLLTVTYATTPQTDPQPKTSGATIPIRIQIRNFAGVNLSSSTIAVTAYGVRLTTSSTWLPAVDVTTGVPNGPLQFLNSQGGQYKYQLGTTGLAPGVYYFGFTVANDPVIHTMQFTIQ